MNQEVKVVFGQYTAQRAITARGQLNADAAKALNDAIAYDPIFVIEGVQIEDIEFSKDYHPLGRSPHAGGGRRPATASRNWRKKSIKAEIAVTQATGRVASVAAEAQAQADATTLRGNAEASAIKAKGDALAANPNLVALIQAERWNGVLPTTLVPGSTVPFLNVH